jgi:hypothetical protein
LAYEIEEWNETGTSYVWVKVPEIDARSNTDHIWMYYGNNSASAGEDPDRVWNSNFEAVWHLNDDPGPGGPGDIIDSTANDNDGTAEASMTSTDLVSARIGDGLVFDGADDLISAPQIFTGSIDATNLTYSAWIKIDAFNDWGAVLNQGQYEYEVVTRGTPSADGLSISNDSGGDHDYGGSALSTGTWYYVSAVKTGTEHRLIVYNDSGLLENAFSTESSGNNWGHTHTTFYLGHNGAGDGWFEGIIDEARVSNVARSADWIAAEYVSMTGAFVSYSGEESAPALSGIIANDTDGDGDPLNAILIDGPSKAASFTLNADGTFSYTPFTGYTGADSFTYRVNDVIGGGDSNIATVNINVVAPNTAPVANDDPSVYNTTVTDLNPISYWRLGESSGTTAVDEEGIENGTYTNGPLLNQTGAISGDSDTAVYFDGNNDYVEIAHDPAYLIDEGAVQLWFNADEYGERGLFSKDSGGNGTGGHFEIKTNAGGQVTVRLQSTTVSYLLASTTIYTPGEWHHVVVTFGTAGMQLWIDGQLEDTDAYTDGLGTSSGGAGNFEPIAIGADTSGSDPTLITPISGFFKGFIDEVAVFGSQITADEIVNLYGSGYAAYTTDEDTALSVSVANGVLANDTDPTFDPLNAILVTDASNGSLTLNADGSFSYTPNADFSGTDSFTYKANDGTNDSNVATATIFVRAINDAPINNLPAPETTTQDADLVLSTGGGNAISISDDDAGSNPVQVTLSATNGTLTLPGTTGLTFTNGDGTADGGMTFTGTVADINAALNGLTYTPNSGYVGPDLINITTTDQGNSGLGGALADSDVMSVTVTGTTAPVAVDDPDTYLLTLNELAPVAHWRLGESAGTTAVDERGIQDGTYTNGPLLDQMGAIAGDTDTAAYFDGTDDYIEINHDSAFLLDEGTIQLWFNVDAITVNDQGLISKDAGNYGTGGHVGIVVTDTGAISVRLQSVSGSVTVQTAAGLVTPGEWHHVAFSFGSTGMALYVDGELADFDAYTGGLGSSSGGAGNFEPIAIGAATSSSDSGQLNKLNSYFAGYIDEVAILGSQLTAGQAEALFNAGVGGYEVAKGGSLTVTAAEGVLANDNDPEGDSLTAILVSGPSSDPSFTLNGDGSFTYTPDPAFDGYDTFTYKVNDGSSDSNVATATLYVSGTNDAPSSSPRVAATPFPSVTMQVRTPSKRPSPSSTAR